ncbi:hypothetical protein HFM87_17680 [Blautia producta]|nr:hypothetical protein [Blautia producta]NSG17670.1 hypothetical protein [Blautia producta]NSJ77854.1 hypothetical protein [Blautia producta]
MLKKLLKYDWKSVSLLLLILHGILLVYTLIGRLGIAFGLSGAGDTMVSSVTTMYGIAAGLYIFVYVLFIFAIVVATYVYLAIRFQKNLFSDEGYLTHTLPVSPTKLIWSKMLVAWAWIAIDLVCVIVSVFLLVLFKETSGSIGDLFHEFIAIFTGGYGTQNQIFMIILLLSMIAQLFGFYTTLALFSMCLGSLFKTHKILGAIVTFFGINTIFSLISTILMFVVPAWSPVTYETNGLTGSQQNGLFLCYLALYLVCSVIFFLGSLQISPDRCEYFV